MARVLDRLASFVDSLGDDGGNQAIKPDKSYLKDGVAFFRGLETYQNDLVL